MSSLISLLLLLLLLLLSLSVTACTGARLLSDAHTKLGAKSVDVKKVRLLKPLLPEEKLLEQVDGGRTSNINGGNLVGATVEKKNTKDSESLSAKDEDQVKEETNTISGHEYEMSPSGVGFQEATKLEVVAEQVRNTSWPSFYTIMSWLRVAGADGSHARGRRLESGSNIVGSVNVADEESRESSGSDVVPGVFSRDYEQPQRKPPIHN
ncbi:hypothetical protein H6P81_005264 [Aristolochia fimbriata]|uniref:Uncharacterized protein n=1 Tax=Aristolochia fimbriata TaxID=158543 RepID=A0AAV7ETZ3_ARIFI|nr:hypothetical protein H6P81_005264 [Aristolochia fimbriata]